MFKWLEGFKIVAHPSSGRRAAFISTCGSPIAPVAVAL